MNEQKTRPLKDRAANLITMFKKRFKPTEKKIDLSRTVPQDIHYYCKTSVLDKIVCGKLKRDFNPILAEEQEKHVRFYFIVKKNYEYDVVSGVLFEPYLEEHQIEELPETAKAKACIDHYVNKCCNDLR